MNTERTTWGEQGMVPDVPRRAIPTTALRARRPQRPVTDLPLFTGEDADEQMTLPAEERTP